VAEDRIGRLPAPVFQVRGIPGAIDPYPMAEIDAKTVMTLRKSSGAPMMDCKKALIEADGDMAKAQDIIRKKGLQSADAKASRDVKEGVIFHYLHHDKKLGVLAEVACETDFVAPTKSSRRLARTSVCISLPSNRGFWTASKSAKMTSKMSASS
jgi:translation elongation factor Ts